MTSTCINKKNPTVTIAISTLANNLDGFINKFSFEALKDADEVLIIIQGKTNKHSLKILKEKYTVIQDDSYGISRSRNIAIRHATCDYIWFMDDDIQMNDHAIATIKHYIGKSQAQIFTVRMKIRLSDIPYKKYPNKNILNRINLISVSSVEVIVSKRLLIDSNIRFNELLGLGTKYPSCEENIFLLDLYDISTNIVHIPEYVQNHYPINREMIHFKDPNRLFAKGVFCRRYSGIFGMILLMLWVFKSIIYGSNYKNSINLIRGYKDANKILN